MTEVPEHLLRRSRERRAALTAAAENLNERTRDTLESLRTALDSVNRVMPKDDEPEELFADLDEVLGRREVWTNVHKAFFHPDVKPARRFLANIAFNEEAIFAWAVSWFIGIGLGGLVASTSFGWVVITVIMWILFACSLLPLWAFLSLGKQNCIRLKEYYVDRNEGRRPWLDAICSLGETRDQIQEMHDQLPKNSALRAHLERAMVTLEEYTFEVVRRFVLIKPFIIQNATHKAIQRQTAEVVVRTGELAKLGEYAYEMTIRQLSFAPDEHIGIFVREFEALLEAYTELPDPSRSELY